MAFPTAGPTLGSTSTAQEEGYRAWADAALAIADCEPVTMVVDPSDAARARNMLGSDVELLEAPVDEFWMRDVGPTFVQDRDDPGRLGAVDWTFNGWGTSSWAVWERSAQLASLISREVCAERLPSLLVTEGGGFHVDGQGTVLLTETVQLDPRRNPHADRFRVEQEVHRLLGTETTIWLPRGLSRDYGAFGTNGHVDIVAAFCSPGTVLLHAQPDANHPDHAIMPQIRQALCEQTDTAGRKLEIIEIPAPETLRDDEGFVDWSYINHYVANGAVIACSFGDPVADARARELLSHAYPGREVLPVEARPIFERGGGIHCITQQQPKGQS